MFVVVVLTGVLSYELQGSVYFYFILKKYVFNPFLSYSCGRCAVLFISSSTDLFNFDSTVINNSLKIV